MRLPAAVIEEPGISFSDVSSKRRRYRTGDNAAIWITARVNDEFMDTRAGALNRGPACGWLLIAVRPGSWRYCTHRSAACPK